MTYTADYSGNIKRLRKAIDEADAIVIGAGAGCRQLLVLPTVENALKITFLILERSTDLRICIPAVSILIRSPKRCGHIGQDISL